MYGVIRKSCQRFNISYILPQLLVSSFYFLAVWWHEKISCITANEEYSMVCLNRAVLGTAIVRFHYSSFLSSHPTFRIDNWLRNNPLWSVHYKRRHSKVFCNKTCIPTKLVQPDFFANFLSLTGKLWTLKRFSGSLCVRFEQPGVDHDGIFTHNYTRNQTRESQVGRHDVTLSGLARPGCWAFVSKWRLSMPDSLETNFLG